MAEPATASAAAAAKPVPSGPNMSVIKGPCNRVSSLGVVRVLILRRRCR